MIRKTLKIVTLSAVMLLSSYSVKGFTPREFKLADYLVVEWPEPRHEKHPEETVPLDVQRWHMLYNILIIMALVALVVWRIK